MDRSAEIIKRFLPFSWAVRLLRIKYLLLGWFFFNFCQRYPKRARKALYKETQKQLPMNVPLEPHFTPKYGSVPRSLLI